MRGVAVILAGGSGSRLGAGEPKAFAVELAGHSMLQIAVDSARSSSLIAEVVAVVPSGFEERARSSLPDTVTVLTGGPTRQASAAAALDRIRAHEAVAIHDAARCLCPPEVFDRCMSELDTCEAVIVASPVSDTIKTAVAGVITSTIDRAGLWRAQTPQAFHSSVYIAAHERALEDGFEGTDDASLVERIGVPVGIVEGPATNIKITTPSDVAVAAALFSEGLL